MAQSSHEEEHDPIEDINIEPESEPRETRQSRRTSLIEENEDEE